jgi:hypothetical protein
MQAQAGPVAGTRRTSSDCITICLIGNFDLATPTATQRQRLARLVNTLQSRLAIRRDQVWMLHGTGTAADVGGRFPVAAFREQLLP